RDGAERADQIDAARVGQLHVDDGDVEPVAPRGLEAGLPGRRERDLDVELARSFGHVAEVLREALVVVDDQDPGADTGAGSTTLKSQQGLDPPVPRRPPRTRRGGRSMAFPALPGARE